MTKLTQEQIQIIERFLDKKKLNYVDVRIEILDHMILQIEQKMKEQSLSFEEAFGRVKIAWKSTLDEASSWMLGTMFFAPKIVVQNAKKRFQKYFILSFIFLLIFGILGVNVKLELPEVYNQVLAGIVISLAMICLFNFIKIKRSKKKTMYSFLVRTQILTPVLFPFYMFVLFKNTFVLIGFLCYIAILCYTSFAFVSNHQKIINAS